MPGHWDMPRGMHGMSDVPGRSAFGPAPPGMRPSGYMNGPQFVPERPPAPPTPARTIMMPQPSGYANGGSVMKPVTIGGPAPAPPPMRSVTQTVPDGYANSTGTKTVTRMVPATPPPPS